MITIVYRIDETVAVLVLTKFPAHGRPRTEIAVNLLVPAPQVPACNAIDLP